MQKLYEMYFQKMKIPIHVPCPFRQGILKISLVIEIVSDQKKTMQNLFVFIDHSFKQVPYLLAEKKKNSKILGLSIILIADRFRTLINSGV